MIQDVIHFTGECFPIDESPDTKNALANLMLTSNQGKSDIVDRTTLWQYSVERNTDSMSLLFYRTPPVLEAVKADRLLFVGTRDDLVFELSDLYRTISASEPSTKLSVCTTAANFWRSFFDRDNFLDSQETSTIPKGIISTGKIRNSVLGCNETLKVADRLERIASSWGIPLRII
jgi:hypothetical protein